MKDRSILKVGRRILLLLLSLLLILPIFAFSESEPWTCPSCGQTGNTGNFCPNCATGRPISDTEVNLNLTQIRGETNRVMVNILRIDGSSYLTAKKNKYQYAPEKAIDEDPSTCWEFSAKKGLKGKAWLAMIIEGETVDEVWIRNGIQTTDTKGNAQYPLYSRLQDIQLQINYNDDRESKILDFTLPDENTGDWIKLDIGRQENVYDVWLYIQSIYKGKSKADTVCLSEFMLVQYAPAEFAMPSWRWTSE